MSKSTVDRNSKLLSENNVRLNILPHYGLEGCEIEQIKFKNTKKQRAVYKVTDTLGNHYSLKKVFYGVGELLFTYSAVQWWHKKGVNVPIYIPTNTGGRFVTYENLLFIMTPWIEGTKMDYDSYEEFIDTASNLALMHSTGKPFIPIAGSISKSPSSNPAKSIGKRTGVLINSYNSALSLDDEFSKMLTRNFEGIFALCEMAYKISDKIDYKNLTKSLCHLDYVNKNIIFDKYKHIWIIDFDNCKYSYVGSDICHSLRRYLKRSSTLWDYSAFRLWMETYNNGFKLTRDDFMYIFMNLVFPQRIWKLTRDYYKNYKRCNRTAFVKLLTDALNSIEKKLHFAREFQLDLEHLQDEFTYSPKFYIDFEVNN